MKKPLYVFGLNLKVNVLYPNSTAEGKEGYIEVTSFERFPDFGSSELAQTFNSEVGLKQQLVGHFQPMIKKGGGIISLDIVSVERL